MERPATVIRDAVHGDLELDADERRVVDTPVFQRLRGIKQLGTAHLVYPCALHTRFEHALGTLHLVKRLLAALPQGAVDAGEARAVRLAALLHDVTHIPYGHTFEDERRIFDRHDRPGRTRSFLAGSDLRAALDAAGARELVEGILTGDAPNGKPLLAELIKGTVGADLLDYLARDSYFCGFRRTYDERVFRLATAAPDAEGRPRLALAVHKRGRLRADALSEILHVLRLRYTLCERVYFHHAKVSAGAMVSRAVELAVNEGLRLEDLFGLRDEGLFALLRTRFPDHVALRALLDRVERRALYKRAFVLDPSVGEARQAELCARYHDERAPREALERQLAGAAGLDPVDVIVYCPGPRMAAKEGDIPVVVAPGEPVVPLYTLDLPEVDDLIAKHRQLWRFYVFVRGDLDASVRERLAQAAGDALA